MKKDQMAEATLEFVEAIIEKLKINARAFDQSRIANSHFNGHIFRSNLKLPKKLVFNAQFRDCEFFGDLDISGASYTLNTTFENTIFHGLVNFSDCTFKKVRFHNCEFHGEVNFENTKFTELCDFWKAKFFKQVIFLKTDFLATTVFSSVIFNENALFTYSRLKEQIIFRGTVFKKGLDLSLTILEGELQTYDMRLNFETYKAQKVAEEDYEVSVTETGDIPYRNKVETYRILKYAAFSRQDIVSGYEYSKYETLAYSDTLGFWKWAEKINVWLNSKSNLHGTSWTRGILFTTLVGLIFFQFTLLFYGATFSLDYDNVSAATKFFMYYLNVAHKPDFIDEAYGKDTSSSRSLYYVFDFLGRIFISYGIYQTAAAFRKHRAR